jgi:hypothetical protein
MEKNVDECIGESLRSVDQMCFSSQFSFEVWSGCCCAAPRLASPRLAAPRRAAPH